MPFPAPTRLPPPPRRVATGVGVLEITLSLHDAGAGPAVVPCHGFPELAYCWRHLQARFRS